MLNLIKYNKLKYNETLLYIEVDKISSFIIMMFVVQNILSMECTVEDWIKLKSKIQIFLNYDIDNLMTKWLHMLNPILDNFIDSMNGNVKW